MLERDVAPGIHRIEDVFVNWYLVEDDDGVLVVDAGLPRSYASLIDALGVLGRDPRDLRAVVLTHGHVDHLGFAGRLELEHDLPVHLHEADRPLLRSPLSYAHERSPLSYRPRLAQLRALAALVQDHALKAPRPADVRPLASIGDLPGRPRVVPTPGHTPGHVSLHFPDRDAVIAGDALVTHEPYTGHDGPSLMARASTADSAQALASLDALAAIGARYLLPGHGEPWRAGVAQAAAAARARGPV